MSFSSFLRSFFPSPRLAVALSAAAALSAQAASAPATPAHSHTPAVPPHGDGAVVTLDQFVTSVAPFARNQIDLAQATTVLAGRALRLKQQATLGETLAGEAGVHATAFGAGASRPIIRGLGGDRIRLLENGVGTFDASVASPDHAVSVEPFLVERIEVVRGPASLLYGSNAVGGVVNVITHRIETDLPAETVRGSAEVRRGSGAEEWAGGGVLDVALRPGTDRALVLHLDGFRRTTKNLRIPGFAESARLREEETAEARAHGEPAPAFARDRLPNSSLVNTSAGAGLSYVSKTLHLGVSHSGFDSAYGVPGHGHAEAAPAGGAEGIRLALRQRRTDVQGEWHDGHGFVRDVRFKFGRARYRHAEIEPAGEVGTVFTNRGHEARVELLHGDGKPRSGAFGAQHTRSDFAAAGEEAFLPPSRTDTAALFAFEEIAAGPVAWQFGGRVERNRISVPGRAARRDDQLSGSAGAVWKFSPDYALAVSLTRTGRAPNAQELFAYGPHAGTQAFEIGDARLRAERSVSAEASIRRRAGFVTGTLTVFTNRFSGYIFEQPTGLVAVEDDGEWEFLPPGDEEVEEHGGGLPVYRYVQRRARFHGVELETLWHLHDHSDWQLDLRLAADLTRGREGARHLPRIPAGRVTAGLFWATEGWSAGLESQFVARQTRVAPNETPSDRYALVSAHVSRTAEFGGLRTEFFLRGTNLGNAEARPHPSFVKDLAPLAGRGVLAGLRVAF